MVRTDLAMEATEAFGTQQIPGVDVVNDEVAEGINRVKVHITSQEGEKAIGKKQGTYVTLEAQGLAYGDTELDENCSKALAEEIRSMAGNAVDGSVLVVGLGNRMVTPDALGPAVCDMVFVTRHIHEYAPDSIDARIGNVSAIAPGVLGITGVETGEIIEGVVERIKPTLIIAIDSLASRSMERIRTTLQIADSGIAPGSGIGNKRKAIDKETLGVPVLALGVPLVVYAIHRRAGSDRSGDGKNTAGREAADEDAGDTKGYDGRGGGGHDRNAQGDRQGSAGSCPDHIRCTQSLAAQKPYARGNEKVYALTKAGHVYIIIPAAYIFVGAEKMMNENGCSPGKQREVSQNKRVFGEKRSPSFFVKATLWFAIAFCLGMSVFFAGRAGEADVPPSGRVAYSTVNPLLDAAGEESIFETSIINPKLILKQEMPIVYGLDLEEVYLEDRLETSDTAEADIYFDVLPEKIKLDILEFTNDAPQRIPRGCKGAADFDLPYAYPGSVQAGGGSGVCRDWIVENGGS